MVSLWPACICQPWYAFKIVETNLLDRIKDQFPPLRDEGAFGLHVRQAMPTHSNELYPRDQAIFSEEVVGQKSDN